MKLLVTGAAGFIGFHTSLLLLKQGHEVVGLDNVNDYYDVSLKYDRLSQLEDHAGFKFYKKNLEDKDAIDSIFRDEKFERVVHLAAQAGVRYSLTHPHQYIDSNLIGFMNILEGCCHNKVEHLAYASSSSVYGLNTTYPLSVDDNVDHPVSLYAATKKANELMAHSYSHLYRIPTTGLRFFSVYGPWGRPDMACYIFVKNITEGNTIDVYNNGNMIRDFTYISDIVEGVVRIVMQTAEVNPDWSGAEPDPASSSAPYRLYNIGCNTPVKLMDFIREIEKNLGIEAKMNMMPIQPGDVPKTHADVDCLIKDIGYQPKVTVAEGVKSFVDWYRSYQEKVQSKSS